MNKKEKAIEYFRSHFNCAQSVFTVFGTENGLTEDQCLKTACGFGGGIGRQQIICGAVSGAVMALGMRFGKALHDPEEMKIDTYSSTRNLINEFIKLNGSVNCKELLKGLDMNDPEDHKKIEAMHLFEISCEKYVADAVEITEKLVK